MYTGMSVRQTLRIRLDPESPVAAYRQIVDQIRAFVIEGALAPGDALPPVRRMALELGVHFNTVAEAYRILADEVVLEIVHGHGARVPAEPPPRRQDPSAADYFHQRLRELVAAVRSRGLSTRQIAGELKAAMEDLR